MQTIPFGGSSSATSIVVNNFSLSLNLINFKKLNFPYSFVPPIFRTCLNDPSSNSVSSSIPISGLCRASEVADFFPSTSSPEIFVREARLEDFWGVAEAHCSIFFPRYRFPFDFALRANRLIKMLSGFSIPNGCQRTFLVAVVGSAEEDDCLLGRQEFKLGIFDGRLSLDEGCVAGILTVDTLADFLPRKGPLQQRRTGVAYISNVAVWERYRRKGIAKKLIAKAEAKARSWGCRAIALHCDDRDSGATNLYLGQGFRIIQVPKGANWPQPKTSPDIQFNFMMKLIHTQIS